MPRFQLVAGKHYPVRSVGDKRRKPLRKGAVVECDDDLEAAYPNKFKRLDPNMEVEEYVKHPTLGMITKSEFLELEAQKQEEELAAKDAEAAKPTAADLLNDDEGETSDDDEGEDWGDDVTEAFDDVPDGVAVYKDGKNYSVVDTDSGEKLNDEPLTRKLDVRNYLAEIPQ